jgi:hypothetical protein
MVRMAAALRAATFAATAAGMLSGCSVGMALSGSPNPDLGAVKTGASRGEIEMHLGSPRQLDAARRRSSRRPLSVRDRQRAQRRPRRGPRRDGRAHAMPVGDRRYADRGRTGRAIHRDRRVRRERQGGRSQDDEGILWHLALRAGRAQRCRANARPWRPLFECLRRTRNCPAPSPVLGRARLIHARSPWRLGFGSREAVRSSPSRRRARIGTHVSADTRPALRTADRPSCIRRGDGPSGVGMAF